MSRLGSWLFLLVLGLGACRVEDDSTQTDSAATQSDATAPSLKDDSAGTLLIWVSPDGAFHTGGRVADVPADSRRLVRVIFEKSPSPSAADVWVSNLTQKLPDGSYRVTRKSRKEWEGQGQAQRQARVEALRPAPEAPPEPAALAHVRAIIYGASWCGPCHLAEDYLKKKGVQVVKRDIEEDPSAGTEMHQKLRQAGLHGASIPVLDVGGIILVGFSAGAVDAALQRSLSH